MGEFESNRVEIDDSDIIKYVLETYHPADVFPEGELAEWAENNGFIKE